jgi:hypothetical protein
VTDNHSPNFEAKCHIPRSITPFKLATGVAHAARALSMTNQGGTAWTLSLSVVIEIYSDFDKFRDLAAFGVILPL